MLTTGEKAQTVNKPALFFTLSFSFFFLISSPLIAAVPGLTPGQFSVDKNGGANYSIPIVVPPGTAGMQPNLSINYNSHRGNGLLGVGWSLGGLSAITRCGKTTAQDGEIHGVDYSSDDRFCLNGRKLVAISGSYGADGTAYRTEIDTFAKIVSYGSAGSGPEKFLVQNKAGQTLEYGYTTDSRIEAQSKTDVRVWAVNKIEDTVGNYLTITYTEDSTNGEYRPDQIDYTGNVGESLSTYASVEFLYENRYDMPVLYTNSSSVKITKRLTTIQARVGNELIRRYQLTYDNNGAVGVSRLIDLKECNGNSQCYPNKEFSWQNGGQTLSHTGTGTGGTHAYWDSVIDDATYKGKAFTGDFNGDGKTDLMMAYRDPNASAVSIYHWHADANGKLAYVGGGSGGTHAYWDSVIDDATYKGKAFTGDFNGDGKTDLMMLYRDPNASAVSIYHWHADANGRLAYVGGGSGGTHAYWDTVVDSPTYKGKTFTGDFNGDGKTDLMMAYRDPNSSVVTIYHWHADANGRLAYVGGGSGGTHAYWDSVIDDATYKGKAFTGDFNGDGKTDLMMLYRDPNASAVSIYHWHADANGKLAYVGGGSGGTHAYWDTVVDSPTYKGKTFTGDFNGDGKTDLMMAYRDPNSSVVTIYHWHADANGRLAYVGGGSG